MANPPELSPHDESLVAGPASAPAFRAYEIERRRDMRKLTAVLSITLDGVVESPEKWPARYFDTEVDEVVDRAAARSDTILLGRRTYEVMAESWPGQADNVPMARYMNGTPKYVVSSTLKAVDWANTRLVTGDLAEEVAELKRQPGKDIQVIGSPTLVRSLLRDGLLDELGLLVHPIVVGGGTRLFEDLSYGTALRLVGSHAFQTGVVFLTFEPARILATAA
jgi:dihydrofolate reductase